MSAWVGEEGGNLIFRLAAGGVHLTYIIYRSRILVDGASQEPNHVPHPFPQNPMHLRR